MTAARIMDHEGLSRRVAVAGATGVVGRILCEVLSARGDRVVPMSRASGVDLVTGRGLDEALTDVDMVVDVSGITTAKAGRSVAYFTRATTNLLKAEQRHGVGHHVALSITGTDRFRYGYYQGKHAQERLVEGGPVPWTILRTTQFHEFAEQMLHRMRWGRVAFVPRMLLQPVAAEEVALRLAHLLGRPPSGRVRDLAGPERMWLPEMTRKVVAAAGERVTLVPVTAPGAAGRAMATGELLPRTGYDTGHISFDDWLGARSFDAGAAR